MKAVRVLLVEDQNLVRAGIRALLEDIDGIEVVAEADDGPEALRLIKSYLPDVALVDIMMPVMNGIELSARVSTEFPRVRVLILSGYTNEAYVLQSLRAGAAGYLVKGADIAELERAIRAVARGENYLSSAVSKYVAADYASQTAGKRGSLESLTPRQREVLKLIAEGYSTKEIAQLLKVSVKTVETHRAEIMSRLEIGNLAGLVRYAIRIGLVTAEQ
jgi:DNA-binding NarL/FixJ family response regulator